jgi:hypothetical protein
MVGQAENDSFEANVPNGSDVIFTLWLEQFDVGVYVRYVQYVVHSTSHVTYWFSTLELVYLLQYIRM